MKEATATVDEWAALFSEHRNRLRDHAVVVADALDATLGVLDILATTDTAPPGSVTWDEIVEAQPSELDRADLQAKVNRSANPAAFKENPQ